MDSNLSQKMGETKFVSTISLSAFGHKIHNRQTGLCESLHCTNASCPAGRCYCSKCDIRETVQIIELRLQYFQIIRPSIICLFYNIYHSRHMVGWSVMWARSQHWDNVDHKIGKDQNKKNLLKQFTFLIFVDSFDDWNLQQRHFPWQE